MSLLDELKRKLGKRKKHTPSLAHIIHKSTQCPYSRIFIPDRILDPVSHADAQQFLSLDITDRKKHAPELYDCDDFARNLYNNARNYGLTKGKNWAWGLIWTQRHALCLYVTSQYEVVFIEPQTDKKTSILSPARFVLF
ncbi:hypothetical protein DRN97_04435 [Methanosarcinales archaeon]|nr:MAG: hypothetical protein DRN97_04435 [Methanosarcinales archaeon]